MERKPIVLRNPIVPRTAIYERIACCSSYVKCENCKLCREFSDCSQKTYVPWDSSETSELYRVIYVPDDYEDWETLEAQIWELSDKDVYLRLIIDKNVPKEVLWAASYSEKNIFQINVNMIDFDTEVLWVQKLVSLAGNCGLYVVLFLYPIVPDLVKTYHVIDILDMFRNSVHFHVTLKFSEITDVKETDGYLNFNGSPVSVKHLTKTDCGWKCTSEYLRKFLEIVNLYAIPRKISVSICGETDDCTGLGG